MNPLDHELALQDLLTESGLEDDLELRDLVAGLRSLAPEAAPTPSPAVAALLLPAVPRAGRRGRRGVVVGVLLAASLGGGAAAAAASPAFHRSDRPSPVASAPARLDPIQRDQPVAVPAPAEPGTSGTPLVADAAARPADRGATAAPEPAQAAHAGSHRGQGSSPSATTPPTVSAKADDSHRKGSGKGRGKGRGHDSSDDSGGAGD